ncbi:hypothetical protein EC957_001961 [Mortierella hygrophila]|uniref:WSC domain-containing protein n=1 Tax=Mortierella hygrophila TaxID=979708 RepID=A0A9P6F5K1_9FUNG|nr:hypothetical protein EC957_001961 [Mortierella hygrophila]
MSQQQPDTSTATPSTVTSIGCFKEQILSPDLDGEPPLSISRAESCFTHCSIGTWSFAGIRNGTICTCGDSEQRKYGSAPESSCSTKCPENQSAFDNCGGPEANNIYFVGAMTPKVPWPIPSINPNNPNPIVTPPSSDDDDQGNGGGNNGGMLGNTKHASTAMIASVAAVAVVAVLAIATLLVHRRKHKGRRSMSSMEDGSGGDSSNCRFDRHDKGSLERGNNSDNNTAAVDPYSRARTDHGWFVTGHRDLGILDDTGSIFGDDDSGVDYGKDGRGKECLSRSGSRKKEHQDLFEGFESSAMDEDRSIHIHPSAERHPSIETALNNSNTLAVANGPIIHHDSTATPSTTTSSDDASSITTTTSSFPLGQPSKFSLAAKIGSKMGHLKVKVPTHHHHDGSNAPATIDHAPISPISPISPTSRSSSTSSTTTVPSAFSSTTTGYLDIEGGSGGVPERSPTSATPSFSFASAPAPGPASNLQESKKSPHLNYSLKYHHNHHHEPPSPISPQKQSIPSPTSPRHHGVNSRHQKKQHRSDLIKDLILQGDSALEDKELALMAQYQPHHCWQQQHHAAATAAAAAAAAAATPTMPPKVVRKAPLERAEKPASERKTVATAPAPAALIIPSPRDYLAPPPRILVHKAL